MRAAGCSSRAGPVTVLLSGGRDSVPAGRRVADRGARRGVRAARQLRPARRRGRGRARCPELCARLGGRSRWSRPGPGARKPQAWARDARYAAAGRRPERGASTATGHTATDQVETILYRLVASPGRRALLGMAAARAGSCDPLLAVTRAETPPIASDTDSRGARTTPTARALARNRMRDGLLEECARCIRPRRRTCSPRSRSSATRRRCSRPPSTRRWRDRRRSPRSAAPAARARRLPATPRRRPAAAAGGRTAGGGDPRARAGGGSGALEVGGGVRAVVEYGRVRFAREPGRPAPTAAAGGPRPGGRAGGEMTSERRRTGPWRARPHGHARRRRLASRSRSGPGNRAIACAAGPGGGRIAAGLFGDRKVPRARRGPAPSGVGRRDRVGPGRRDPERARPGRDGRALRWASRP